MARTNKYTSINFNDIFEKKSNNKTSSSSSSSSSSSTSSSVNKTTRNHGGMLVLTRPTPKPLSQLQPQTKQPLLQSSAASIDHKQSRSEPESDPISLRPLGRTGSSSLTPPSPPPSSSSTSTTTCTSPPLITLLPPQEPVISLKPQPFVPPHLRPGFVRKEEKVFGQRNQGLRSRDIGYGQLQNDGENGRPTSGGGYERIQRGGESDLEAMNRPSSSGNRPSSSGGWYAGSSNSSSSSYRSPSHY